MTAPPENAADSPAADSPAADSSAADDAHVDDEGAIAFVGPAPAGYSVGARLGELLEPVFTDEPPVGPGLEAVYRRAERLRRRRSRAVVAAGVVVVLLVTALGYGLTTAVLPTGLDRPATQPAAVRPPDPALAVFATVLSPSHLRIIPRDPARGDGWRQYLVLTAGGQPRGLVEVSAYIAPDGLCFPVLADKKVCARPDRASDTEYVRYADDRDMSWQVNEVMARRRSDGRTIVVQVTGERGVGGANGRPPLSARQTASIAVDPRLAAAFGARESCDGPDPACPVLRVPVPRL